MALEPSSIADLSIRNKVRARAVPSICFAFNDNSSRIFASPSFGVLTLVRRVRRVQDGVGVDERLLDGSRIDEAVQLKRWGSVSRCWTGTRPSPAQSFGTHQVDTSSFIVRTAATTTTKRLLANDRYFHDV